MSHLSSIGFHIKTQEEFHDLIDGVARACNAIPVAEGAYLRWIDRSGAELWLQRDKSGSLIGVNPHFNGPSRLRIGLTDRIERPDGSVLDGAYHAWMAPRSDNPGDGEYPFVFDSPDARIHPGLDGPTLAQVQIAAFPSEITVFESKDEYEACHAGEEVRFAPQSFIPVGLFQQREAQPPRAYALFTGYVRETRRLKNAFTKNEFVWAAVETLGGSFDVVLDPTLAK